MSEGVTTQQPIADARQVKGIEALIAQRFKADARDQQGHVIVGVQPEVRVAVISFQLLRAE